MSHLTLLVPVFVLVANWQDKKRNYFFAGLAYLAATVPFILADKGALSLFGGIAAGLTWGKLGAKGE